MFGLVNCNIIINKKHDKKSSVGTISSDIPKIEAEPAPSITPIMSITYHSGNLYKRTVRPTESMIVRARFIG